MSALKTVEPCERCGQPTDNVMVYSWEIPSSDYSLGGKRHHIHLGACLDAVVNEYLAANPPSWTTSCFGCNKVVSRADMIFVTWPNLSGCHLCPACASIAGNFESCSAFLLRNAAKA